MPTRYAYAVKLSPEETEKELLYGALVNLGQSYPIDIEFTWHVMKDELSGFDSHWKQYNPRKPNNPREGLSLTSLDGGLSGVPDLDSLYEYNRENGTTYSETSFCTPTPALLETRSLREGLKDFMPHLGRSHLIRLHAGGYFPYHRDGHHIGAGAFRLVALLANAGVGQFCFLHGGQRILLEMGKVYFLNTKVEHALFSFGPNATLLVLNVKLSRESVDLVCNNLLAR